MPASIYILKEKGKTNNPTNIKQENRRILKSRSTIKIHYTFKNDFKRFKANIMYILSAIFSLLG